MALQFWRPFTEDSAEANEEDSEEDLNTIISLIEDDDDRLGILTIFKAKKSNYKPITIIIPLVRLNFRS